MTSIVLRGVFAFFLQAGVSALTACTHLIWESPLGYIFPEVWSTLSLFEKKKSVGLHLM